MNPALPTSGNTAYPTDRESKLPSEGSSAVNPCIAEYVSAASADLSSLAGVGCVQLVENTAPTASAADRSRASFMSALSRCGLRSKRAVHGPARLGTIAS